MDQVLAILEQVWQLVRPDSIGDVFIYTIFIGTIVNLSTMPDGNDFPQYLMFGVIFFCIIDLLRSAPGFPIPGTDDEGFVTFIIHVGMFVFPWIAAGATRTRRGAGGVSKGGPSVIFAVLTGVIGALYSVLSFLLPQVTYQTIF